MSNRGSPLVIRYRCLRKHDVKQVQSVALRSWSFTYRKIFSTKIIKQHVSTYYSAQSFEQGVFPRLRKGEDWFYVVLEDERLFGFSHITHTKTGWELLRIYLLPEHKGKGIGKKLLQLGERFLRRKRAREYCVFAYRKNRPAVEFYIRNGFTRAPGRDAGEEVCLEKKLRYRS